MNTAPKPEPDLEPASWDDAWFPRPWSAVEGDAGEWEVVCDGYNDETPVVFAGTSDWPLDELHAKIGASAIDLLILVNDAAAQFRFHEAQHLAKGTADGDAKAEVNAAFAMRCENLVRDAVGEENRQRFLERYRPSADAVKSE